MAGQDPRTHPTGERRYVSVLFSDLSGLTSMSEQLDPEDVQEITSDVFTVVGDIVQRFDGRMDRLLGDAILATFGDPVSREDDAERAVRAALEMHRAVEALKPDILRSTGHELRLHTGVNSGLVVTGGRVQDVAQGPLGDTVNVASRLQSVAALGEIVIGQNTADLVAGVFELEDGGAHAVKGKAEPVRAWRVRGIASTRTSPSRRHGAFVGRHEELGALLGALEHVRDGGREVFTIVGDAGAGKTRLLAELQERAGADVQWLEGRAYAHGSRIPYAPIIDLISNVAEITEDDAPPEVRRKLTETISAAVPEQRETVLAPLLRLYAIENADEAATDRESFHTRLLDAILRLIEAVTVQAPTVFCLQDLHWADPSTMSLLTQLVERATTPSLFVGNTRPGVPGDLGGRTIQLSELSERQTRQLVGSLLDDAEPAQSLVSLIVARAEGNPFFIEEIVNSFIESGVLVQQDGIWRTTPALHSAVVPSTIRGVIAARIDRLDDERKRVLREAAVVGREFLFRIINEVSGSGVELEPCLEVLERADLIREKSTDPDLEYFFKHALTQEVAYDGLVKKERQELHARVARAIEAQLHHREGELVEVLAHHWLRAGVTDQAVRYLRLAGKKAIERYALDEANHHFSDAYGLLIDRERTPAESRMLAETLIDWVLVHYYLGDLQSGGRLLERHLAEIEATGDPELVGMALAWRGNAEWIGGRLKTGLSFIDRAIEIGEREDNAVVLAHAISWKIWINFLAARPGDSLLLAERLTVLIPRLEDARYVIIKSTSGLGFCCAALGMIVEARRHADDLFALADRTGSTRALAMAHGIRAALANIAGDWTTGTAEGRRGVDAATDPVYKATVMAALQYNLAGVGDATGLRAALEESRAYMSEALGIMWEVSDAVCQILEGKPARGMRALEVLRDNAREHDVDWITLIADAYVGIMYARIATREVQATASVALRNPGFVVRHAVPARRKAHRTLGLWQKNFLDTGRIGLALVINFEWAKLLASEGKVEDAARQLRVALDATAAYGPSDTREEAQALLDGLTSSRRTEAV
jgi:class 3 adenylate cyclase